MFSKKNRGTSYPSPYLNPNMNNFYPNPENNSYDQSFWETEINELKRQNTEISKRLSRIENYLGIRREDNNSLF